MDNKLPIIPNLPLKSFTESPLQGEINQNKGLIPPKQIIVLGGGFSVSEGISKGLWDRIKNHFVIGINFASPVFIPSMPFEPTILSFRDKEPFYERYKEELKSVPLIVGKWHKDLEGTKLPNTILLKNVYGGLAGVWSLNLVIKLLDEESEVFILGFDCGGVPTTDTLNYKMKGNIPLALQDVTNTKISEHCKQPIITIGDKKYQLKSHWYDGWFTHKGTSKLGFYYGGKKGKDRTEQHFGKFRNSKYKVYNVSMISRIPESIIPKIDYSTFFSMLDKNTYNQSSLREWIKGRLR